jgi:membrane fusion protein (multidrug efflux system)
MSTVADTFVNSGPKKAVKLPTRAIVVAGAGAAAILAGVLWIAMPETHASTDDAYVKADTVIVAPKVQGLVEKMLVGHNQSVTAGQPLVEIDPEDYERAVDAAKAELAAANAGLAEQSAQQALAAANARAAAAGIQSANAQRTRAMADDRRFSVLAGEGDVSQQQADTARATAISADAAAQKAMADYAAARQQLEAVTLSRGQLVAAVSKARAALALAQQNLTHTVIRAPIDGVVGDRQAEVGDYVQPGTQLMTLVPMRTLYVDANFKETQTAHMAVGQPATVKFDALPGRAFKGSVASFAPGSGSIFSLLPFEPATGNFTRIVQRVPVRIVLDPRQEGEDRLRPGLSAEVRVDFR